MYSSTANTIKIFLLSFPLLILSPAIAQKTMTFNGILGAGSWSNVLCWAGGLLVTPAAGDSVVINGTCTFDPGTATCAALTVLPSASIVVGSNALTVTNGVSGAGTISIGSGTLNIGADNMHNGTFTPGTGTLNYTGANAQSVRGTTYANLGFSGAGIKTLAGPVIINAGRTLTINSGSALDARNNQISSAGATATITINGTLTTSDPDGLSGSTITAINSSNTTITLGPSSVIEYSRTPGSTKQIISSRSDYAKLKLSGGANKILENAITISDSLNIVSAADTLSIGSATLTLNGPVAGAGTIAGSATSNLTVGGSSAVSAALNFNQLSSAAWTLNNFTINRSAGATLNSSLNVSGGLTLTSGILILNGQALTLSGTTSATAGTISGGATSSMIIGGSGNLGNIPFTAGSQQLNNLTINRTSSGTATLSTNLTMASTGALTFSNGMLYVGSNTLTINGDLAGASATSCLSFNGSSNLVFGGSGTFSGSLFADQTSATTRSVNNITLNRTGSTLTLGNPFSLIGALTLSNGRLASAGKLTLISTAGATAMVNTISGTGSISGNVTVQRYIPATARRWRFMSSPVGSTTLEDWRGEIYITGPGTGTTPGTLNSNGFDATLSNQPGVYTYDETVAGTVDQGWTGVTNSTSSLYTVPLVAGKGYRVFVRGDRTDINRLNGTNSTQNAVTTDLTGTLNTGNISLPVSYTSTGIAANDGWCLVGNPYPAPYDWNAFWDTGNSGNSGTFYSYISPVIYVFDPLSNSYKSFNALSNTGTQTSGFIAYGQSFFIQTVAPGPSITFTEQFKTSSTPLYLFKNTNTADEMHARLQLDSITYDDYILKLDPSALKTHDSYDIQKFSGAVNISSYASDSVYHTVDVRPEPATADTVLLNITGTSGNYTLSIDALPVTPGKYFYLQDQYAGTTLLLNAPFSYPFSILSANTATYGKNRFSIIITTSAPSSLPVKLVTFEAKRQQNNAVLSWSTAEEVNMDRFDVERSTDGRNFTAIESIRASNGKSLARYQYTDDLSQLHNVPVVYYRLKQADNDRNFSYSLIREITLKNDQYTPESAVVWPNPAQDVINIKTAARGLSNIELYTPEGALQASQKPLAGQTSSAQLHTENIHSGVYLLKLTYQDATEENRKIIIK